MVAGGCQGVDLFVTTGTVDGNQKSGENIHQLREVGSLTSHSLQGELYIQTVGKALGFLNHQQYHLVVLLTKIGLSKRLPHGCGTCKLEDKHQQNQKFFPPTVIWSKNRMEVTLTTYQPFTAIQFRSNFSSRDYVKSHHDL